MRRAFSDTFRQLLVLTAFVGMILFTLYASVLPLNGQSQQQVAANASIYLLPASYAFSIWIVIYVGLIAYVIYQYLPRQKTNTLHKQIAPWFILSCAANCAWVYCWHYGYFQWALCAVLVLIESLMTLYLRLGIGRIQVHRNETLFVRIPFSLYFGWLTIITIITISVYLNSINWDAYGLEPELWAIIVLGITALISGLVALRFRDFVYASGVIWGFIAIAVEHNSSLPIAFTVVIMSVVMLLALLAVPTIQPSATLP